MRSRQRLIEIIDTLGSAVDVDGFASTRYLLNWSAAQLRKREPLDVFHLGQLFNVADNHPSPYVRELVNEVLRYGNEGGDQ